MNILILVLSQLPSLLCLAVAGYLAIKGMSGWGWFIFAALLVSRGFKLSQSYDDGEKPAERPAIERTT